MPRITKQLTAAQVKALRKKPGTYNVGGVSGLLLQVTEHGAASWILRATVYGRVRHMGLGSYAKVGLEAARAAAREAHEAIAQGRDPIAERAAEQREQAGTADKNITFEQATRRYHKDVKAPELRNERSRIDWLRIVKRHAFPVLGKMPVGEIELKHVLEVLEPLWPRPTGQYVRASIENVLDWATVRGYRDAKNAARWQLLKHVLPKPTKVHKVRHYDALPFTEVPGFMADLRQETSIVARCLEFTILTAARGGEVRRAEWSEFDLEKRLWVVPPEHMKRGKEHRVPLSEPAVKVLESVQGREGLVFQTGTRRPRAIYDYELSSMKLGRQVSPHGFRSSFKDFARACTGYADEVSELALAHVSSDATRAAYARDGLLEKRRRLMKDWASYLETGKVPGAATVTNIKEKKIRQAS